MDAAEGFQSFARRTDAAFLYVLKSLPNPFKGIGSRRDVEEVLIGFRILHDRFRFAIDSKNQRSLRLLETLHEFCRITPEGGHGLNILLDVEHIHLVWE
jgi:hypothetical protein